MALRRGALSNQASADGEDSETKKRTGGVPARRNAAAVRASDLSARSSFDAPLQLTVHKRPPPPPRAEICFAQYNAAPSAEAGGRRPRRLQQQQPPDEASQTAD
uniref:Uncharacterized protein n=1 Tax=Plectus sambesii TaxID=2011161 RepID=A0A914WLS6_9BILA